MPVPVKCDAVCRECGLQRQIRIGLQNNQFGIATAAGLFKSVVSFVFIAIGYGLAYRFADYTIF